VDECTEIVFLLNLLWVCSEAINMQEVEEHISFRNSSKTRTELKSPYNFLPFFLPRYFNDIDRIIYLDTDIVVKVWNIYLFECKLCDAFLCFFLWLSLNV
jgi:lipopolysaccharide biosynthesis glycosyltransferase